MSYEDAVKAVQITSINQAVQRMEYIISQGEPRSSIRGEMLAEVRHIQHIVEGMGGQVWSNLWRGDIVPSDVAIPQDWRRIRGTTLARTWPIAQVGDIVTHDGRWEVLVNFVHGQFSVYAIIRYYRF